MKKLLPRILIALGVVLAIWGIWIAIAGLAVKNEYAKGRDALETALRAHSSQAEVKETLTKLGFEITDGAGESVGQGPAHWAPLLSWRIAVSLKYDGDGKLVSYRLD